MNGNVLRRVPASAIDEHSLKLLNKVPAEALNALIAFLPDPRSTRATYHRMVEDSDGRRIAVVFQSAYVTSHTRRWKLVRAMWLPGRAPSARHER